MINKAKKLREIVAFQTRTTTGYEPTFYVNKKEQRHIRQIERLKRMHPK